MAKRKIIWTAKANFERKEILEYWIERNKSKAFSIKLNRLIIEDLKLLSSNPKIGKKTEIENVRVKIIRDYLILYEVFENEILVLTIWDSRRNPNKLK
jgi:plasmid stabilization system protein ParE